MLTPRPGTVVFRLICLLPLAAAAAEPPPAPDPEVFRQEVRESSARREQRGLAEPFTGITTDGRIRPGLFHIRSTGVSTAPVKRAAEAFLAGLEPDQRRAVRFPVDADEWRKWANVHRYDRAGVSFEDLDAPRRQAAFDLLAASLSAKGLRLSRDIMRLNETLAELRGNNYVEYGRWKYSLSIMGEPSLTAPWGWQLDGHHLIVNYFVLGDQVVMTPAFWGSEPAVAGSGKHAGTRVLQEEQAVGLAMLHSLDPAQFRQAVLEDDKDDNRILAQQFSDNLILDYAGIRADTFTPAQRQLLLDLIGLYVGNLREPHARLRMQQVERYLDETWFAWIGGDDGQSVYYYRIHSPVILIEFDHQKPAGLRYLYPDRPNREHIHTVVRTPNGNDYGKDLLRQHYEEFAHGRDHSHGDPVAGRH